MMRDDEKTTRSACNVEPNNNNNIPGAAGHTDKDDDDKDDDGGGDGGGDYRHQRRRHRRRRLQRFYEQLGAPVLVYRPPPDVVSSSSSSYSSFFFDELPWFDPNRKSPQLNWEVYTQRTEQNRTQVRWYYPMDYHQVRPALKKVWDEDPLPDAFLLRHSYRSNKRKRPSKQEHMEPWGKDGREQQQQQQQEQREQQQREQQQRESQPAATTTAAPDTNESLPAEHWSPAQFACMHRQCLPLQEEARAHMLFTDGANLYGHDDLRDHRWTVRSYQQYDTDYIVPSLSSHQLTDYEFHLTRWYDTQRIDRSDPAHVAHIPLRLLHDVIDQERPLQSKVTKGMAGGGALRRAARPMFAYDDPGYRNDVAERDVTDTPWFGGQSPRRYGNCLVVGPCQCTFCQTSMVPQERQHGDASDTVNKEESDTENAVTMAPSWCLLHPTGPLLDSVRISYLMFPHSNRPTKKKNDQRVDNHPSLDLGDSIRQMAQCGPNLFVARTTIDCTIFRATFGAPTTTPMKEATHAGDESKDSLAACCQTATLTQLYRIDLRSLLQPKASPLSKSYIPIDLACHPKYGRQRWSGATSNIAIVCESTDRKERNVIYHVLTPNQPSDHAQALPLILPTKHEITNLETISKIDFSAEHPMVLWAAARSYVRPLPSENMLPRVFSGSGYSLYSVDLRSNQGTFQWSPSAEDRIVEGVHSISGILTDWSRSNTLWVSSISAGKTWEIDTRMPCRAVNTWSLPYACDEQYSVLPPDGLYGAGTLFASPTQADFVSSSGANKEQPTPMFSVGLSPETYGIHVYQRPDVPPRFQTKSLESAACPGLLLGEMSVATSSVFALPDVSKRVFTCGLACLRLPTSAFLSVEDIRLLGYSHDDLSGVLCCLSMTNKGDIYAHSLVESMASRRKSRNFDGLPAGSASLPLPKSLVCKSKSAFDHLCVTLSETYPSPHDSFAPAPPIVTDIPDLPKTKATSKRASASGIVTTREVEPSTLPEALLASGHDLGSSASHITLAAEFIDKAQTALAETLDAFDTNKLATVEELARQKDNQQTVDLRSDVTADLLREIVDEWPRNRNNDDNDSIQSRMNDDDDSNESNEAYSL